MQMKDMLNTAAAVDNDIQWVDAASRFHFKAAICPLAGKITEDLYLNKTAHRSAARTPSRALHAVSHSLVNFLQAFPGFNTVWGENLLNLNTGIYPDVFWTHYGFQQIFTSRHECH